MKGGIASARIIALVAIGAFCWARSAQPASSDPPTRSAWGGVYTAQQAKRGDGEALDEAERWVSMADL
jgi:hypothetical protein